MELGVQPFFNKKKRYIASGRVRNSLNTREKGEEKDGPALTHCRESTIWMGDKELSVPAERVFLAC